MEKMSKIQQLDESAIGEFEDSLARCVAGGDFTDAFYGRFLGASDEVRHKFAATNFEQQKKILEQSLSLMALAGVGQEKGLAHLESIARSHSKKQLDISPSLYALWLECLLVTAEEKDPEFTPHVKSIWRTLMQRGIERMVDVYRQEQTVHPPSSAKR